MRSELLGPGPLVLGAFILALALLLPAQAVPPTCGCPVYAPADFDALEGRGYLGVGSGSTLVVDGRVVEILPSEFLVLPYRWVRLEGSAFQYNVTGYDPTTARVGDWVRLITLHMGETEARGPDTGHRWVPAGKTAPAGTPLVSLAGLALGFSVAAWGAATWKEFGRSRRRSSTLRGRLEAASAFVESDPAFRGSKDARLALRQARVLLGRGQFESAEKGLGEIDQSLAHSRKIAERIEAGREASRAQGAGGDNVAGALADLHRAEEHQSNGKVDAAHDALARAEATLAALPRLNDLLAAAEFSLAANRTQGVEDQKALADLESARAAQRAGRAVEGVAAAERAVARLREVSPAARRALDEITALKEFLAVRPQFDREREVRDRVRDSQELYRLGQYDRALAEARVGLWLADPQALAHSDFEALVRAWLKAGGYALDPVGSPAPPLGFLAAREGERTLVITQAWREFPGERILLAAKDFLNEQGAERALVYSSSFTDTSTDERVRVLQVRQLVELLREAALKALACEPASP